MVVLPPLSPAFISHAPVRTAWTARQTAASVVTESAVVDDIMDKLKGLTLLEASELVSEIEETFGVDASAGGGGMMMAMPAAGGDAGAAEAAEEQTEFSVMLTDVPADKKIAILKVRNCAVKPRVGSTGVVSQRLDRVCASASY